MKNRERVLATLAHRQPDKTPYSISFTQPMLARMAEFYSDPDFESKLGNCFTSLGSDPTDGWQEVEPDIWRDPFGVHWNRSIDRDIGTVCNRLVTPANVRDFRLPDPTDPNRFSPWTRVLADRGDRFTMVVFGFTLFERAWTLAGMDDLLAAMVVDPTFVHTLLDRILEFNLALVDNICKHDVDAILFGDDWGMQNRLLMGRKRWREFIQPRVGQMYARAKAGGKFVFQHSCGKVDEIFPELIDAGLDVFNPLQPEVIDVIDAKQRYGDRLCFYGGISVQRTLPHGTVTEVRDEVHRLIEIVGRDGGLFASPSHSIPGDARPENVAAMIEVLQNQ